MSKETAVVYGDDAALAQEATRIEEEVQRREEEKAAALSKN